VECFLRYQLDCLLAPLNQYSASEHGAFRLQRAIPAACVLLEHAISIGGTTEALVLGLDPAWNIKV